MSIAFENYQLGIKSTEHRALDMNTRIRVTKLLNSLPLLMVLILGGASYMLAQKGEYEASMGAVGTAVAVATARGEKDRNSEREKEWMAENERLRLVNEKLEINLALSKQGAHYQAIINDQEIKNVELRAENRFLSSQQQANLLPESQLKAFQEKFQETQSVESSASPGDEKNA